MNNTAPIFECEGFSIDLISIEGITDHREKPYEGFYVLTYSAAPNPFLKGSKKERADLIEAWKLCKYSNYYRKDDQT